MKTVNRAQLRGEQLKQNCYIAKTVRHEFGRNDNRVFCYGVVDPMTDDLIAQCRDCKALIDYAEPLEEEV